MIFYRLTLSYREKEEDEDSESIAEKIEQINESLGAHCGLDERLSMCIVGARKSTVDVVVVCDLEKVEWEDCQSYVLEIFSEYWSELKGVCVEKREEITPTHLKWLLKRARGMGYVDEMDSFASDLRVDYFDNYLYHIKEKCYQVPLSYEMAMKRAKGIMADESFIEELERIYAKENIKKFYGNPVHYCLRVGSKETAQEMIDILIPALKTNERLLGTRCEYIYDIDEGCYEEDDVQNIFEAAKGCAVVIDMGESDGMDGNYSSAYEKVIHYFQILIEKYHHKTLMFFIDSTKNPGFSRSLIAKVEGTLDLVEICEGSGSYEKSIEYFQLLSQKTDFPASRQEVMEVLTEEKTYTTSQVQQLYDQWYSTQLKTKVYQSYRGHKTKKLTKEMKTSEPYKTLQEMIGLEKIKGLVDQIISLANMQRLRRQMGLPKVETSLHMIFMGNPGTAKTSVARLLAQILKKEGVLEVGHCIEVGRSDLVAKYVGWTAKSVSEKFREARGGVLFIDEAYALVDDANNFGDEAINTIVQEMENHREDVVVIFAGYPEKMKEFLNKNEGLRSRIAFHLSFPDYNAQEMTEIFALLAKKKDIILSDEVREKCQSIFKKICGHEEFGNGRFARNLLEQALMRQAQRIFSREGEDEISREEILTLKVEDIDENLDFRAVDKKRIGFLG